MGRFLTTHEFIKRASIVHENKFNYSLVEYKNSQKKVKIICPIHGEFEQRPNDHIQGKSCIMCAGIKKGNNNTFIEKAKKQHGDKYNYSIVEYKNTRTKVKIICPVHGEFEQVPYDHINGFGCAKCGGVKKLTTYEFSKRAKELHGNKYNYSLVDYKNMHTKVKILCVKHGEFNQTPHNHLKLAGCPTCNKSKGEKTISWFLDKNNIKYKEQKTFKNCFNPSTMKLLPFDFYLLNENVCIEFQGIQHYEPIKYMGGEIDFKKRQKNDIIKKEFCEKNGINLITIKYSDKIWSILQKELHIK